LFVTVSSRLTGEIGSSSNPISGMTVATLLLTCLIFLIIGWTGPSYYITALSIGGIVCIASSNGGTTSQDLKTGFLVGGTPKYQQIAILIGALASALVLGPILMQLGPDFAPSELPALAGFLPMIPRDVRVAVEFRQRGWIHDGIIALLAEHNVAVAFVDARWIPRKTMMTLASRPTSDVAYIRWMGPNRDLVDYSRIQVDRGRELESWAAVIAALANRVKTVYGYVNNHFAGHSPASARELQRLLHQRPVEPDQLGEQMSLF